MQAKLREITLFLGSVRLALVLISAIIITSFAGCFLPDIYKSLPFIALVMLFTLNLSLCTLNSLKLARKRLGATIAHFSVLIILLGAAISALWGERGVMELYEKETKDLFITEQGALKLDFKLSLNDFSLERYKPEFFELTVYVKDKGLKREYRASAGTEYKIKGTPYSFIVLRYFPDFSINEKGEAENNSDDPRNPALLLRIASGRASEERWVFARHPHMSFAEDANIAFFFAGQDAIKEFRSNISITDKGQVVLTKDVKVNAPVKYKGYTFYQMRYDPDRPDWTALEVVRDPGALVVFLGFVLLNAGIMFNFYLKLKER